MPLRPLMLWFGKLPNDDDRGEAMNRELGIAIIGPESFPPFAHARAAVFWAAHANFELVVDALEKHLADAINHGLLVYVVVANDGQRREIERAIEEKLPCSQALANPPRVRIEPVPPHEAPNKALLHDPGRAPNVALEALGEVDLTEQQRCLLQRAFSDCRRVALRLIAGGKSGALTFLVDATLAASNAGPRPLPYFAKLGNAGKLADELRRYQEYAENHIAWHLRPNFDQSRCLFGARDALLVGSFVESSCSLWEAIQRSDGPAHIRTLFGETLAVWRDASDGSIAREPGSVVEALEPFWSYGSMPARREERAKQHGGVVHPARSLWRKMLGLQSHGWTSCVMHGDMHGENARVRKEDVIVIDFAKTQRGPVCADLASLEVWLTFKIDNGNARDLEAWRTRAERLYRRETIDRNMRGGGADELLDPIAACAREIRLIASDANVSADEYATVLALYLLRHASFRADANVKGANDYARSYAYWLANRIICGLCDERARTREAA